MTFLLAGPEETIELKNGLTAILRPVTGAKDVEQLLDPALSRGLVPGEAEKAIAFLGSFYGLHDPPDAVLAGSLYGTAFGIGRRRQMGIDPAALRKAILEVREEDLRKAETEIFGKDRRAAACVLPKE